MTPLEELDDVWTWYLAMRQSLRRIRRFAEKYWDDLPWHHDEVQMWRDTVLGKLPSEQVAADAQTAVSRIDDLAVIELFSVFEGIVRRLVAEQVENASASLSHPMLIAAARDAVEATKKRSFAEVLSAYGKGGHANIAEQVRQVRKYRNWITHGRRGEQLRKIEPKVAYDRLCKFLELILPPPPIAESNPTLPEEIP
jgi:hypothetical protein